MRALSIRAPWWWYILHAGKDIENRDWPTGVRGRILIHAGKWWDKQEVFWDVEDAQFRASVNSSNPAEWPDLTAMKLAGGCLVGSVEIVDCITKSDSLWFEGEYGFTLCDPIVFCNPVPLKGALGFFQVPDSIELK